MNSIIIEANLFEKTCQSKAFKQMFSQKKKIGTKSIIIISTKFELNIYFSI
jgi:hypothetical protein